MGKGFVKNLIIIILVAIALFFAGRFIWDQVQKAMGTRPAQDMVTGVIEQEQVTEIVPETEPMTAPEAQPASE